MFRRLIVSIVAGIVVFIWGAIDHTVLPLGTMGLSTIPNEDAVVGALRSNITAPGLYIFPGRDMARKMSKEEEAAYAAKLNAGPSGVMAYRTSGGGMSVSMLLTELLTNIAGAFIAGSIVARLPGSMMTRAIGVAMMGLFAWFSISLSYWNWYGFPSAYIAAEGIDQVVGWFLGGLVLAKMTPKA